MSLYNTITSSNPLTNKDIILDIDNCLAKCFVDDGDPTGRSALSKLMSPSNIRHRPRFFRIEMRETDETGEELVVDFWGVKRVGLDEFLTFCEKYFRRVIVWSAGSKEYVIDVVAHLFKHHRKPYAVLTRDDTVQLDKKGYNYHKPLSVIEKNYPNMIVRKRTLFLDNKGDNFRDNPKNGVTIPDYDPLHSDSYAESDTYLLDFAKWLMLPEVIAAQDVTKLSTKNIFNLKDNKTTLENFPHRHMITTEHKILYAPYRSYVV